MRGRKPKPTAIRIAEGNRRMHALPQNEAKVPAALCTCPRVLGREARTEWRRIAKELFKYGLLTVLDRGALVAYCFAYGEMIKAIAKARDVPQVFRQEGSKCIVTHPYLQVGFKAVDVFQKALAEFGMSPASRARALAASPEEQETIQDFVRKRHEMKVLRFKSRNKEDADAQTTSAAEEGQEGGVE